MAGQLPEISTARLRLRRPEPGDALRLAQLASDADVARMLLRMPHPYALSDAEAFLARVAVQDLQAEPQFAIDGPEGMVGMLGFRPEWPGPEVGYWIGRPFWGGGYASEALEAALRYADGGWRKKVVVSGHFVDNPASGRVLVKGGFLYTGVVERLHSLARSEPVACRRMIRLA